MPVLRNFVLYHMAATEVLLCTRALQVNKVVLAYSGGLDTSVILKWLQETYDCEVVTFTADLGQVRGLAELHANVATCCQPLSGLTSMSEVSQHKPLVCLLHLTCFMSLQVHEMCTLRKVTIRIFLNLLPMLRPSQCC